jgi:hypothetical protein
MCVENVYAGADDRRESTSNIQYSDLSNALIKRFSIIIGSERAQRVAANVPGLMLDGNGRVAPCVTVDTLDRLAREYQVIGGTIAVLLMKKTVAPLAREANLPLPGILR